MSAAAVAKLSRAKQALEAAVRDSAGLPFPDAFDLVRSASLAAASVIDGVLADSQNFAY